MAQSTPASGGPSLADRVQSLKLPTSVRVPHRRRRWSWWLVALLVLAVAGWWYGSAMFAAPQPTAAASATATSPAVPEQKDLEAGGYIVPAQKVQISPKVGGEVVALYKNLEEGTFVPKGTVLANLETVEYEFDLRRAQALADLAKARLDELRNGSREEEKKLAAATLKEAQEQLEQARDEWTRLRNSGRGATADELVRGESKFRALEQKVEQQKQNLKMMVDGPRIEKVKAAEAEHLQALAERDKSQWRLDNCKVVSPIDGVILEKKAEVGNTVRPEAFSNGLSASLCDMADLTNLEVDVDISERDIFMVKKGQACEVWTDAKRDKKYVGTVSRLMPVASRSKASIAVRVKIQVPAGDTDLRPEMRARVKFFSADAGPRPAATASTSSASAASGK